jgi:peroxiredoxin
MPRNAQSDGVARWTFVLDKSGTLRTVIEERDATKHPTETLCALSGLRGA